MSRLELRSTTANSAKSSGNRGSGPSDGGSSLGSKSTARILWGGPERKAAPGEESWTVPGGNFTSHDCQEDWTTITGCDLCKEFMKQLVSWESGTALPWSSNEIEKKTLDPGGPISEHNQEDIAWPMPCTNYLTNELHYIIYSITLYYIFKKTGITLLYVMNMDDKDLLIVLRHLATVCIFLNE